MIPISPLRVALPLVIALLSPSALLGVQTPGAASVGAVDPAPVVASQTGAGEITVTWTAVPGAIGYNVGRSVFPNGFQRLCQTCPPSTTYVDRDVKAGARHIYRVVALLPGGRASRPALAAQITPQEDGIGNPVGPGSGQDQLGDVAPPAEDRISNVIITRPVNRTTVLEPIVDAGVPPDREDLATPPADTASSCSADTSNDDSGRVIPERPVLGTVRADADPRIDSGPGEEAPASSAYQEGKCRNPGIAGYPTLWDPVAAGSGFAHDEQVEAWKEIGIVALAYKHILQRHPTADETKRHVASLRGGRGWKELWRELAQSAERDQRFGFWAPAPLATTAVARQAFDLPFTPAASEQCFGGLGPACAGTVPGRVEPRWFGFFELPDGTQMGYVSLGVAVGSILHDNACLRDRSGLNCNGLGAGDLIKTGAWPGSLEWNKAAWNLIDGRTWREVFGPYPTNTELRLGEWYDDVRLVDNRLAMMAEAISIIAFPGLTVFYRGGETRQSKALKAPPGTSLDDTDRAFCASGRTGERQLAPFTAAWAFCE